MACCTNTYDLGCHSQCDLLELADLQWASTGDFCFFFSFAGNTYTWETEGVEGYSVELSMQYLNEDGSTTFQIKNSSGVIQTFEIAGTEYDCFKISSIPAGCGTSDLPVTQTCSSPSVGVEGDLLVWDYSEQQYIRLPAGPSGEVLTSNGAGTMPTYEAGGGGGGSVADADNGLGLNGDTVELGINDLNRDTPLWAAGFNLLFGGIPEANKQWEYDSGPDLFKLNAHHGLPAINGIGFRYMLTFDGTPVAGYPLGKPTSWFFVKTSNDTPVGGDYLASIGYFNALTGAEAYWEATDDAIRGVVTDGTDEISQFSNLTEGHIFRGKDALSTAYAFIAKDVNDVVRFRVRNNGLIDISGGGTIDPTAGNNGDVLTDDGSGNWSMQAPPAGGSGKLVYVNSMSTLTSVVGLGYSFATPIYIASLTIPANTLQAGDIIHVMGNGRRAGSGNSHMLYDLSNNVSRAAATANYGTHGGLNTNPGVNWQTFVYANGDFWDATALAPTSAFNGDAYANGATGGGFTQASAGAGQINFAAPLYLHCWGIAAATCTLTHLEMSVKIYRP